MTSSLCDFSVNLGKNYKVSFLALISISLSKVMILVLTPQAQIDMSQTSRHCWKWANPLCPFFPSQIARQLSLNITYTEKFYRPSSPCAHVIWKYIFQKVSSLTYAMHSTRNNTRCTGTYFLPKQPSETLLLFKTFKL